MASVPTLIDQIGKSGGVLTAVYSDLAAPGVRQVGLALETVFKTGNILLLPLRMMNDYAATFEKKNFAEIADRFSKIPEDEIIDVNPEVGNPILEKLSISQDPQIRQLFIELLSSAANKNKVRTAHPSFVKVIECLSPDEATLLKMWHGSTGVPCLRVLRCGPGNARSAVVDVFSVPKDTLIAPEMMSMYVANMAGLGLISHKTNLWLADDSKYDQIINMTENDFPGIKGGEVSYSLGRIDGKKIEDGDLIFEKGFVEMLSYGRVFQIACI